MSRTSPRIIDLKKEGILAEDSGSHWYHGSKSRALLQYLNPTHWTLTDCFRNVRTRLAKPPLELLRLSRFAVVGILATSTHVGVVWLLIGHLAVRPLLANLLAFLVAFGVSFIGQYRWTFRSTRDWRSALWRFLVTALLGFAMNNILLVALLEAGLVSQELSAVLAVGVIPLVTYTLSRLWVFR